MIIKTISTTAGGLAIAWALLPLWHNSACDRADALARPLYYFGKAWVTVSEPVRGYSKDDEEKTSTGWQSAGRDFFARWGYSRESWEHLCASDPIVIARRSGLSDHRDLVRKDIDVGSISVRIDEGRALIAARKTAAPASAQASRDDAAPAAQSPQAKPAEPSQGKSAAKELPRPLVAQEEGVPSAAADPYRTKTWGELLRAWFERYWPSLLILGVALWMLIKFLSHDNKAAFIRDALSKPLVDLRDLAKHLLPRKALKPSVDKDPTDATS